ncbi:MAG: methylisocitrate lyase [Thermoplasmataceae archaeon]
MRDNRNLGPSELRRQVNDGFVFSAGVFNGISAMIAEKAGFKSTYLSGSGVAGAMGFPDLSVTTLTEVAAEAGKIVNVTRSPLIADIDTGFGETINVTRTVREMERAGVSAVHMEDQVLPKKCGHLNGKRIIDTREMISKIRAAVEARNDPDFMIIARTDSRSVNGLEDAIARANNYFEAGADAVFTEALEGKDEFIEFAKRVNGPLMANMTEFGKSPLLSVKELKEAGYRMVIFPLTVFRAFLKNALEVYTDLIKLGTQTSFLDKLMTRKEYYNIIGYDEYEKEDHDLFSRNLKQ